MADGHAGSLLRRAEGALYWAAVAPVLGRMPAALGYRLACRRGDWLFAHEPGKRAELASNLRHVLAHDLSPEAVQQMTREWFRLASCEAVDVKRLRHTGRALRRLVEIRGREQLERALAGGNGVILCSAHFGSFDGAFSMLGASGYPVTTIGRWQHNYTAGLSAAERRFWDRVHATPLRRHRERPNIEPWPGRLDIAARAAAVLRANEVLTIVIDAPPLDSDKLRTVEVPFLGRLARLVPGVVTLAQVTGAPVLMGFLYRSADYCHQVLEISAPLQMEGDHAAAFAQCAAEVSAAISRSPAHWRYWASTADLANLGLVPTKRDSARQPDLAQLADESFLTDRPAEQSADRLAAPG
jgi:lauroyl/myristoyl acyltransferase